MSSIAQWARRAQSLPPEPTSVVKTVYADLLGRVGYRVRQLIENPPDGYRFVTRGAWQDRVTASLSGVNIAWKFQRHVINRLVPANLLASYCIMRFKRIPAGVALTYSESPVIFRREPWIVGVEVVTQFVGYHFKHFRQYRRIVEDALAAPYCRAIICWSEAARQSLLTTLDPHRFADKTFVVYPAATKGVRDKDYGMRDKVRILFVSSSVTPEGFELKGGREAVEAFTMLRSRYKNVELTIRSDVPRSLKVRCSGLDGLRIIEEVLPDPEMQEEWRKADILWYPAHSLSSVVVLEAMSRGIPVVTTDYYDNAELVRDGVTGFVIAHSRKLPPWEQTNAVDVLRYLGEPDRRVVADLVTRTSVLIESPELRARLGRAAREEAVAG